MRSRLVPAQRTEKGSAGATRETAGADAKYTTKCDGTANTTGARTMYLTTGAGQRRTPLELAQPTLRSPQDLPQCNGMAAVEEPVIPPVAPFAKRGMTAMATEQLSKMRPESFLTKMARHEICTQDHIPPTHQNTASL